MTTPTDIRYAAVQAREALSNILDYVRSKDDLYANGAIRQFAEEGVVALDSALAAAPAPQPTGDELRAMLVKARAGLANGLWDYGPGQDEHEQCDALIAEIDAMLAASPSPQQDGPSALRDAVLEEAAKKAESDEFYGTVIPVAIAAAIRGMKGQP